MINRTGASSVLRLVVFAPGTKRGAFQRQFRIGNSRGSMSIFSINTDDEFSEVAWTTVVPSSSSNSNFVGARNFEKRNSCQPPGNGSPAFATENGVTWAAAGFPLPLGEWAHPLCSAVNTTSARHIKPALRDGGIRKNLVSVMVFLLARWNRYCAARKIIILTLPRPAPCSSGAMAWPARQYPWASQGKR